MDAKIEIKKENPLSVDISSQNGTEFFKNVTTKTNSAAVFRDEDCNISMKPKTALPGFCSQNEKEYFTKQSESLIYSSNCKIDIKTEIEEQALVSDLGSQSTEFVPEDPVIKFEKQNLHHEMVKVEIKEEEWWLETQTSSVYDDIKDGDFTAVKSPRLHSAAAASGNSSVKPSFPSAGDSVRDRTSSNGEVYHECENQGEITKIVSAENNVHSQQSGEYNALNNHSKAIMPHLKEHILIHENKKRHKCKICEKSFTRSTDLKRHILIHEGTKPYKCTICEKRFTHLSNLKRHCLIHEGKKPHKCDICDKTFIRLSHLKRHNLIHEGKRPHKCEICEKRFIRLPDLKSHKFTHEGKRPHKCEICDKGFTRFTDLKIHKLIHEGKKPHKCEICEKGFTRLSYLKSHNLTHQRDNTIQMDDV